MLRCQVELTKAAKKDLQKVPVYIAEKLEYWVHAVVTFGMEKVRQVSGFHDESLKGDRMGQRSIRLNKAYRAIYEETINLEIRIVSIVEVNKHEY